MPRAREAGARRPARWVSPALVIAALGVVFGDIGIGASIRTTRAPGMPRWRKLLFVTLAHNAANPAEYFGLPADRTVVMGTHVDV